MDQRALQDAIVEARARTFELIADLSDAQLMVPRMDIVNPFHWEVGHVAWFQEKFVLRDLDGARPLRADGDDLFDSIAIAHDTRWDLPLPPREAILRYVADVRDRVAGRTHGRELSRDDWYRNWLAVFHEDMHDEAFTYMRQTLGYPAPSLSVPREAAPPAGDLP
ncbi:MAG: DinB family protein, partial [Planctomycetes bacterium]|nr:DinB family protein [Planctomycetota bacterium]